MNRPAVALAWYRFRATFGRRWGDYLTLVLLIGSLGGLAMGAVAGARRTQSSFPAFMTNTNPSDLQIVDLAEASGTADSPSLLSTLVALPHVKRVASWGVPNALPLNPDGSPAEASTNPDTTAVFTVVSPNGLYTDQDRVTVVQGRMADPTRADEAVMSEAAARILGIRLGATSHLGFYTDDQSELPGYGTGSVPPLFTLDVELVGIVKFNNEVVQDDIDQLPTYVVLSPALADRLVQCCGAGSSFVGLQLDHGASDVAAVEAEISQTLPSVRVTSITSVQVTKAERAIEPESIAFGAFGGIAALAALLIAGQVIGRQLRSRANEISVLRDLGASPAMTNADALIGVIGAVVVGAVLAVVVAVGLSKLAPLGPVHSVDPFAGVAFDWAVLVLGLFVLIVGLSSVACVLVYRGAPHRVARRRGRTSRRGSLLARAATTAGLPPSAVTGIRFAVEPGSGNNAAPVRSATLGGALAIVMVVATVIFGASLDTLVSRPALYGWNWDYELRSAYSGVSNIPEAKATPLLDQDADIAERSGVYFATLLIDGLTVPVLGTDPDAAIGPSMLSGRASRAANEIVLGAATLAELHKQIGDTVEVISGSGSPSTLVIVGTAALPAVGIATALHMELATGAVVSQTLIPDNDRGLGDRDGPEAYLVRFRKGIDATLARGTLETVAGAMGTNSDSDGPVTVLPVQRPAEIVNYRAIGTTPTLLGGALALGAVTALALTLISSVRRRRRDLAVLRVLGFTNRQLAAVVAWQSTVAVGIAAIVGVPIGIVVGRALWRRFAVAIHVVPQPTVSESAIVLIAFGALVLANLVAAIPARSAARTSATLLLRSE